MTALLILLALGAGFGVGCWQCHPARRRSAVNDARDRALSELHDIETQTTDQLRAVGLSIRQRGAAPKHAAPKK